MISDFRHGVNDICTFLRFYAAYNGNLLSTFQDNLSVPPEGSWPTTPEDGTDRLPRNVGKKNYHSTLRKIPKQRRPCLQSLNKYLDLFYCSIYEIWDVGQKCKMNSVTHLIKIISVVLLRKHCNIYFPLLSQVPHNLRTHYSEHKMCPSAHNMCPKCFSLWQKQVCRTLRYRCAHALT
jgi:hypothetical protein